MRQRTTMSAAPPSSTTPLLSKPKGLLTYDELMKSDPWRADNHHILTGYRRTLNSYRRCFTSIFGMHNETVNIVSTRSFADLVPALTIPLRSGRISLAAWSRSPASPTLHLSSQPTLRMCVGGTGGWRLSEASLPPFPRRSTPVCDGSTLRASRSSSSARLHVLVGSSVVSCSATTLIPPSTVRLLGFFPRLDMSFGESRTPMESTRLHRYYRPYIRYLRGLLPLRLLLYASGRARPKLSLTYFSIPGDPHLRNLYITLIYVAATCAYLFPCLTCPTAQASPKS